MRVRSLSLLLVLLLGCGTLFAQQRNLTGKVVDSSGEGIIGATVVVKGSSQGTITDANGNFVLSIPATARILEVSYVGMKKKEVPITGNNIQVALEDDTKVLEDLVVIGYGTQRKRDLTGAVSSVQASDIANIPVTSAAEAMKGKLAGVQITTTDGSPDAEMVIRVRGGGSVTQDNSPLFIVDGFPVSSINDIPPTDIESIDVLKDASSSAIYGARGANGVVIITTKRAEGGKTSVALNSYLQTKRIARKLDVMSPYEFVFAHYEYAALRGETSSDMRSFNQFFGVFDDLDLYKYQKPTDWQEELFGNDLMSQYYNLSVTGGTDKTKFNISGTFNNDEGLLVGNGYNRANLNFKLNHEITKKLRFELNTRVSDTEVLGAGTSGSSQLRTTDGVTTRPVNGLADVFVIDQMGDDETYEAFLRSMINPVELAEQDWRNRRNQAFNFNTAISWEMLKGLTFRTELGYGYNFGNTKRYYGPLTSESKNVGGNLPLGQVEVSTGNSIRVANTLNYVFNPFVGHSMNLLAGQEITQSGSKNNFLRAKYFSESLEPEKMFANMALGTVDRISSYVSPLVRMSSFFGRAIYNIQDKYMITGTLRADGSNKFAPGKQWGYFPAGAVAWRISEESFLKGNDLLTNLKVRASVGSAGNNRIGNDLWRSNYRISNNRTYGMFQSSNPYYEPASSLLSNPDLRWETTITQNAGLDFTLWKDLLSGTLDVYKNVTKDLLVESDIPGYLGYTKQQRNIGQTSNQGIELTLNAYLIQKKDFTLSASFNIGFNQNKIDFLDGVNEKYFSSNWAGTDLKAQDDYRIIVGQTVGLIYGYQSDGFYTVDDFESYDAATSKYILKEGVPTTSLVSGVIGIRPGAAKFKDISGPDGVPDGVVSSDYDRKIIGNANPKHAGGFNINSTFKGFDISMYFNWVFGNQLYNANKIATTMNYRSYYGNMLDMMNSSNRFTYINDQGGVVTDLEELRTLNEGKTIWSHHSFGAAAPVVSSWAIEDGSFLRLNNVTLGYSLPRSVLSKISLTQLRLYATVNNVFVLTSYSGYDPEVSSPVRNSSYNALTPGVDYSAYPKSRSFTVGINAKF